MLFLNNQKFNRGKPFDGSSILDIDTNLDSIPLYYAIQFYYEVYKKMSEMLEVAFSGYLVGEYNYVPVEDFLDNTYDQFGNFLKFLVLKPKIDKLPVITLYGFHLNGNFVFEIESWNKFKNEIQEDVKYLSKLVTNPHPIPPDLQLAFDRVDIRLAEHISIKAKILKYKIRTEINEKITKLSMPIRKRSKKDRVLTVLNENPNNDATIVELKTKTRLKDHEIYECIYQLKKDIEKYGLIKKYKLDKNEKKNGYKIYILAL